VLITPLLKKPVLDSANPQLVTVLEADFQFIGGVQASQAYRLPAALQLYLSATDLLPRLQSAYRDTSLYQDGHAESTDGHSVCSR